MTTRRDTLFDAIYRNGAAAPPAGPTPLSSGPLSAATEPRTLWEAVKAMTGQFGPRSARPIDPQGLTSFRPEAPVAAVSSVQVGPGFRPAADVTADMNATLRSGISDLATEFLRTVEHYTKIPGGNYVKSHYRPDLAQAVSDYSWTDIGQEVLSHALANGFRQRIVYDPSLNQVMHYYRPEDELAYNFAAMSALRKADPLPGSGLDDATPAVIFGHDIGHPNWARASRGLPPYIAGPPPSGPSNVVMIEWPPRALKAHELETTREFENPTREGLGLPPRRSYYKENDVYPMGRSR